ncbi:hypothetical protein MiSe_38700 [Microseira wollei NIES-4236]|uniref:Uncharacterized protein n=1 Tax=Microseira wollei NIES-4236 TaxID=2530354 RepID=A0AAV3XCJ1_9CYAN|nr:hypothetical protein MiSe_38700 [Microseira wollei NIES-4236]
MYGLITVIHVTTNRTHPLPVQKREIPPHQNPSLSPLTLRNGYLAVAREESLGICSAGEPFCTN